MFTIFFNILVPKHNDLQIKLSNCASLTISSIESKSRLHNGHRCKVFIHSFIQSSQNLCAQFFVIYVDLNVEIQIAH